jgi:uncharacterized protein YjbI with pentapeptide repeats
MMKEPRGLADLPFAGDLRPFQGDLETDGHYELAHLSGSPVAGTAAGAWTGTWTGTAAGGSRFTECAFTGVTFDGGQLRRCRLSDVWFGESRFVAFDMAESSFVDAWFSGCVLAGVQAFSAGLRRVVFRDCKLDSVNFRESSLTEVTFADCVLREVDFGGARLKKVRFPGCQLTGADFTKVRCTDVDLRGATLGGTAAGGTAAGIRAGYESLAGVRIDTLQLMALAPYLAHHLGIAVDDDGDSPDRGRLFRDPGKNT